MVVDRARSVAGGSARPPGVCRLSVRPVDMRAAGMTMAMTSCDALITTASSLRAAVNIQSAEESCRRI